VFISILLNIRAKKYSTIFQGVWAILRMGKFRVFMYCTCWPCRPAYSSVWFGRLTCFTIWDKIMFLKPIRLNLLLN